MYEPDQAAMAQMVAHLFSDQIRGLIELAWTDPMQSGPCHAQLFSLDAIDELIEKAAALNAERRNIYIGAALRRETTALVGRTSAGDFYATTVLWADLDDLGATASAAELCKQLQARPTLAVLTGRCPHERAQCWWRLDQPIEDSGRVKGALARIQKALGGDASVVDPARIMRLAGSIAWPVKSGREVEQTSIVRVDHVTYGLARLEAAFPESQKANGAGDGLHINDFFGESADVEGLIAAIRAGERWHTNMVRLTAHWIERGWSDAEILTAAEALTLPGFTAEQTRREATVMIRGGREKWNKPNPAHPVQEPEQAPPAFEPAFITELDVAKLPKRRWLLGRSLLRGSITLHVAPPGAGKSTFGLEQGVAIITGRPITLEEVHEQAKVWVYNGEDERQELDRRLAAVLQHWSIPFAEVKGRLALNSGDDRPLLAAIADRAGNVIRLPDVDACIQHIRAHQIGLFIVDPFVEVHAVSENNNAQINAVGKMFREIARRGDCAVVLVHHTPKPPQGVSDGHAGNQNTSRGATSLVGVARVMQTLFTMSPKDAETCGIEDEQRHLYVRLDDAKANRALISARARWLKRISVTIANGDEVGVLEPIDLSASEAAAGEHQDNLHRTIIKALLAQVSESELGLNAAARRLAWGKHAEFHRYRQQDEKGNQRANNSLRRAIEAACRACITITIEGGKIAGFTIDRKHTPALLKRFERASDDDQECVF